MASSRPTFVSAAPALRKALLAWFEEHRRPMPWRREPSAYRTVVSELMCQQTQVATVIPYFERWIARWPDFAALARAQEADVLAAWSGLGYYSRARNLLRLAQQVAAQPEPPRTAAGWLAYRGVGPYTAAAIASIAFGEPVAVVDGNVIRVLARLGGVRERFKDGAAAAKQLAPLAAALVDPDRPGDFNQAMMELGSLVCRKAAPACDLCPVARWCEARRQGDAADLPRFAPKKRRTDTVARVLCVDRGRLLLRRYPDSSRRLAGMLELPAADSFGIQVIGDPDLLRKRTIGAVTYEERLHGVTATSALRAAAKRDGGLEWVRLDTLPAAALTGPHRLWIGEWLSRAGRPGRGRRT